MKAIVALIFFGVVALSFGGVVSPFGYTAGHLGYTTGIPLPYTGYAGYNAGFYPGFGYTGYNTFAGNYQLKLDTTLPGSAYVGNYPYGAAPTAYGYGVVKAV